MGADNKLPLVIKLLVITWREQYNWLLSCKLFGT